jgi:tripartite-type tricarboxylate transporter receptor subunit TctC
MREEVMDRWTRVLSLFALLASALPVVAQDYPNRPIRVIASQGAGGKPCRRPAALHHFTSG